MPMVNWGANGKIITDGQQLLTTMLTYLSPITFAPLHQQPLVGAFSIHDYTTSNIAKVRSQLY